MVDKVLEGVDKVGEAAPVVNEEFDEDAEFQRLVDKREAEKRGDAPVKDDEPAEAPKAKVEPSEPEPVETPQDDPALAGIADPAARDALAKRLRDGEEAARLAKKLDLDNRSLAGRMSAYQRRYEEAAGKRPVEVKTEAAAEAAEEWVQFKEDYPDVAKAIESRVPSTPGNDPKLAEVVEYIEQEKRDRFLADAWEAVETVHAGWRETGKTQEFQEWMKSSPTYGKLASSDDVADAIALFDLWAAHAGTRSSDAKSTPAEAAASAKLAARREEQVSGARSPNDRGATPDHGVDLNDEDQMFAFLAAKANKRLRDRYQ